MITCKNLVNKINISNLNVYLHYLPIFSETPQSKLHLLSFFPRVYYNKTFMLTDLIKTKNLKYVFSYL